MSTPLPGGSGRRGDGGRFEFERARRQQPPVVVDVGCNCRAPRLLASLVSSLKSLARGGGGNPKSPHARSSWSSSTTAAFTPSASITTATTASSFDVQSSWGPATYAANTNALYEVDDADERAGRRQMMRRRRRRQRRRIGSSRCRRAQQGSSAMMGEEEETAVAVEVESAAPYDDFRDSMVAMVTEKEMYAWEDLNALLHQFLALNSPRHHPLILSAFADLWAPRGGLFCPPSPCLL